MSDEAYESYVKKCAECGVKPTLKEKLEQGEDAVITEEVELTTWGSTRKRQDVAS